MSYFAVIQRGELIIPIIKGGDGPDAECLATWPTLSEARQGADGCLLAQAYPAYIFDMDDAL